MLAKRKLEAPLVFHLTSKFNRFLFMAFEISDNSNGGHLGWRTEGGGVTHNFLNGPAKDHCSSSF